MPDKLTLEDIANLRELERKATEAPWHNAAGDIRDASDRAVAVVTLSWPWDAGASKSGPRPESSIAADGEIIAASRNKLTALLDIAEQSLKTDVPVKLRWDAERKQCSNFDCCDCEFRPHFRANFCPNCGKRIEWI
jgi:hypothetical protein